MPLQKIDRPAGATEKFTPGKAVGTSGIGLDRDARLAAGRLFGSAVKAVEPIERAFVAQVFRARDRGGEIAPQQVVAVFFRLQIELALCWRAILDRAVVAKGWIGIFPRGPQQNTVGDVFL